MFSKNFYNTSESPERRDYLFYERRCGSSRERRCIDGRRTGCGKCVGYCQYAGHSGFLTEVQRAQHNCIEKECFYYLPKIKQSIQKTRENDECLQEISALARKITKDYEGMRVMNIVQYADKSYGVRYVAITNEYPIAMISKKLSVAFGEPVTMIKINCDFDKAAHLIFAV